VGVVCFFLLFFCVLVGGFSFGLVREGVRGVYGFRVVSYARRSRIYLFVSLSNLIPCPLYFTRPAFYFHFRDSSPSPPPP
jgi:hypothetical protein